MWPSKEPIRKKDLAAFRSHSGALTRNTLRPEQFCVDLHCHPTFMLFNRKARYHGDKVEFDKDTDTQLFWFPLEERTVERKRGKKSPKFFASDFTALSQGNVRVVFASLLPLEQGFVKTWMKKEHKSLVEETWDEADSVGGVLAAAGETPGLAAVDMITSDVGALGEGVGVFGARWLSYDIPAARSRQVQASSHDYFDDLKSEFEVLTNEKFWTAPDAVANGAEAKVVGDFGELAPLLEQSNMTAAIVTIEGGHSLGCGSVETLADIEDEDLNDTSDDAWDCFRLNSPGFHDPDINSQIVKRFRKLRVRELVLKLLKNIETVKNWGGGKYAPFFITFSHHFWNQLCGHAISLPYKLGGSVPVFNQEHGIEEPMTEVGKVVLSALLSTNNGKRILVDTKHMSLRGKDWYYRSVEAYNAAAARKIPIISSHAAVNGRVSMPLDPYTKKCGVANAEYQDSTYFNFWDINLSQVEIQRIDDSDGLIGLNFDERILTGQVRNKGLHKRAKKGRNAALWAEPLADQMVQFAAAIATKKDAAAKPWEDYWRRLAIGSDFDGAINPIDGYCWAADFRDLGPHLVDRLMAMKGPAAGAAVDPLAGRSPEDIELIVDMFLHGNALDFLAKYFTDEYRLGSA